MSSWCLSLQTLTEWYRGCFPYCLLFHNMRSLLWFFNTNLVLSWEVSPLPQHSSHVLEPLLSLPQLCCFCTSTPPSKLWADSEEGSFCCQRWRKGSSPTSVVNSKLWLCYAVQRESQLFAGAKLSALEVWLFLIHQLNAVKICKDIKIIVLNLAKGSS